MLLGSVEAGGTKFVCAVGDEHWAIKDVIHFPTTTPEETLSRVVDYFKSFPDLAAISLSSFGPIELRQDSPHYGWITTTGKPGWQNTNFLGIMKKHFKLPIYWTTDVNGSAYGEYVLAQKQHETVDSLVYYTVGTGIGAGVVVNGKLQGDNGNPEMGHVYVKKHPADAEFAGICPFHGDCLEGLASGPTFEARTGKKGPDIPLTDPVWNIMAYYVAQAAVNATLTQQPDKVVFGGGVISEPFLKKVRHEFVDLINGYVELPASPERYLVMPLAAHNGSATIGNFALAQQMLSK